MCAGGLLLALGCGPELPEYTVLHSVDGRDYRVLALSETRLPNGTPLLRADFEARRFSDRDATRKEALGLLLPLSQNLSGRKNALCVANAPRVDPWSDQREQVSFLFERIDGKWKLVEEGTLELTQAKVRAE